MYLFISSILNQIKYLIVTACFQFFRKSVHIRTTFSEKSDECLSFLEEQKLMKSGKSQDELIRMFEQSVAKEYGPIE